MIVALLLIPARVDRIVERSTLDASASAEAAAGKPLSPIPHGRGFRKTAWLALFATNFALNGTSAMFPRLATNLGIGADVHGALLAAGRGAALVAFVALQLLMFWRTRLWPLWIAQLCCAASIVWIGFAHPTWMFAAAWVIGGAMSGYAYQASIYFTLEEMTEKGKGSGVPRGDGRQRHVLRSDAGGLGRRPLRPAHAVLLLRGGAGLLVGAQMLLRVSRRKTADAATPRFQGLPVHGQFFVTISAGVWNLLPIFSRAPRWRQGNPGKDLSRRTGKRCASCSLRRNARPMRRRADSATSWPDCQRHLPGRTRRSNPDSSLLVNRPREVRSEASRAFVRAYGRSNRALDRIADNHAG